jgi:hypothetical protein
MAPPDAKWLTPAELVFARFDGYYRLAKLLHVAHTTTWRWGQPVPTKRRKGQRWSPASRRAQGQIPAQYQSRILALAKEHRVKLTPQELIEGGLA